MPLDDEPEVADCNPPGAQHAHSVIGPQWDAIDEDDDDTGVEGPSGEPFETPEVEDD